MILSLILGLEKVIEAEIVPLGIEELKPDDVVLGVVGMEARKLYTIIDREGTRISAETEELQNEVLAVHNPVAMLKQWETRVKQLNTETSMVVSLKELFWQEVREEIGDGPDEGIAIRKGWEIVAEPPELTDNPIIASLMEVLGESGFPPDCGNDDCPIHGKHPNFPFLGRPN